MSDGERRLHSSTMSRAISAQAWIIVADGGEGVEFTGIPSALCRVQPPIRVAARPE